nr:hypothetical protein [Paludisphaera borealis]
MRPWGWLNPPAAEKLRRMLSLAQIVQSHALSVFHLSGPDLLLGLDSDTARRNIFGLIAAEPEITRSGILLRQFGQQVIEHVARRKIHPPWSVPGGGREPLSSARRDAIRTGIPEAAQLARAALDLRRLPLPRSRPGGDRADRTPARRPRDPLRPCPLPQRNQSD